MVRVRLVQAPLLIVAIILLVGCSRDLGTSQAQALLSQHLSAVAPHVFAQDSFEVVVSEIITSAETSRQARFRIVLRTHEALTDSASVLSALFQRSNTGWALVRYGGQMRDIVADAVAMESQQHFTDLLAPLAKLRSAADGYEEAYTEAMMGFPSDRDIIREAVRGLNAWQAGLSNAKLRKILAGYQAIEDSSVEWSAAPPAPGQHTSILWVRESADTTHVCRVLGSKGGWFGDGVTTCQDGKVRYVAPGMPDSIKRLIDTNGGILFPGQVNR